ncbi:DUF3624 domain-containing protein [Vibrio sinensis]|uniref:DUF3624 domain-containing protein n=1 Tax=Vibrio sinensis TaxID=2302434 RepID=A0A3A6QTN0_9VIBR|nr:DUF3624 domain-containing protein [Vibrio sinensis]RJX72327.1 DUF3624 domain-containing protein [Vibrio sinensis]
MTCNNCEKQNWFWKKIGKCQRCMNQLTLLSVVGWVAWWFLFQERPKSIESIALLMANVTFNGLLFLHLWMFFVVLPLRRRKHLRRTKR